MSEKVKKGACCGEAVGEGTMAPSGTWWTTLGPIHVSVVRFFDFEDDEFLFTFLGVEFAIEDCFYHVAQSALV